MTALLFSYGTLRMADVQRRLFGRMLEGEAETLTGYARVALAARDPAAVALSGVAQHKTLVLDPAAPPIAGTLLALTDEELLAADRYEGDDYRRAAVRFASGRDGWVYVAA